MRFVCDACQDITNIEADRMEIQGAMLEWAWRQYVGKQTCFDLAAFGGAKAGCFDQHPPEVVREDHKRRENDRGAQDAPEDGYAV